MVTLYWCSLDPPTENMIFKIRMDQQENLNAWQGSHDTCTSEYVLYTVDSRYLDLAYLE